MLHGHIESLDLKLNGAMRLWPLKKINKEIKIVKQFAAWNGFPSYVVNKLINSERNMPNVEEGEQPKNAEAQIVLW